MQTASVANRIPCAASQPQRLLNVGFRPSLVDLAHSREVAVLAADGDSPELMAPPKPLPKPARAARPGRRNQVPRSAVNKVERPRLLSRGNNGQGPASPQQSERTGSDEASATAEPRTSVTPVAQPNGPVPPKASAGPRRRDGRRGQGSKNGREEQQTRGKKQEETRKGGNKKVKVTAEMKRRARAQRKEKREMGVTVAEREEIFEVGPEGMSVAELAELLALGPQEIIKHTGLQTLFMKGIMVQVNQQLDSNTVKLAAKEFGVEVLDKEEEEEGAASAKKSVDWLDGEEDLDSLISRPPVVTVMGHVDHGKTSLLDFIRKSRVAEGEAGGITQSIGAYNVQLDAAEGARNLCFLDTPGHEAFSAMRARGARVTDVAVVIVAADDGVRPQTLEAISHAQAAEVPIVVAINKMDKPGADMERVKQELAAQASLMPEEWGGQTPMVPISAKKGTGVEELLEMVSFVAELEELVANPSSAARGTVIEAHLDRRMGPAATLLVQNGSLRVGDVVRAGASVGKVRSLTSSRGKTLEEAGPSVAVAMLGLNLVPTAGDTFEVYESEQQAREKADEAADRERLERLASLQGGGSMVTLSTLASVDDDEEAIQRLNIILKAESSGALEAVKSALMALPQDSVMLRFLHASAGDITESDINLAAASEGFVVGFNLEASEAVAAYCKHKGVEMRTYRVIYDLIEDVRNAMEGRLKAVDERVPIGEAQVKAVFGSGSRRAAGCLVVDGRLEKDCLVVVRRKKRVMCESTLHSLRRVKDNVEMVDAGTECGVRVDDFAEWQEGDVIEAYALVQKKLSLEEAKADTVVDIDELLVDA